MPGCRASGRTQLEKGVGVSSPSEIRAWAKTEGLAIGDKGRVSQEIRDAFALSLGQAPAAPKPKLNAREAAVAAVKAVRAPRKPAAKPEVRAEALRLPEAWALAPGDPIKVSGEQGNWRFLAVVLQPSGALYVDCVDPAGSGRAVEPSRLERPGKGVSRQDVRPTMAEREASATAHAQKRGK